MAELPAPLPPPRPRRWLPYALLGLWLLPATQTMLYLKILRPTRPAFEVKLPRPGIERAGWWGGSLQPAWENYATQKLACANGWCSPTTSCATAFFTKPPIPK